jgi:hypothetical protein
MKTLRFECSNTGRVVDSGINTYRHAYLVSARVRCPICEDLHEWRVAEDGLATVLSVDHHSKDAQGRCQSMKAPDGRARRTPEAFGKIVHDYLA